ncbi:alpha/beta fold hydrolase [Isoptericola croceus]|uniref:alpha/beta fold hydrolase n=1 Tax=Isoptericola croceus TaxID=3031406 RepID=UPI0023F86D81|nr:alpha/beta fold hydrolase [Isoptericola croceus]
MFEAGDSAAEVVVLVHGIGVSERYFRPLGAELATDRRVIAPDLPGFGRSPRPSRVPTVEEMASLVLRELERRDVGSAVVVGHSMGAQVAAAMMHEAPQVVPRGVLIGPVVDPSGASVARQAWRLARDTLHEPARANAAVVSDYLRAGPRWYSAVLPRMFAFDTRAAVSNLPGPVLVVRGQHDHVCSRPWARTLADAAPRGEMREVPGAGHVAMASDPRVVGRWVRQRVANPVPESLAP